MDALFSPNVQTALAVCFTSIGKLFLISMLGFIPVRLKWIPERILFQFVRIVVDTIVPVTISLALLKGFSGSAIEQGSLIILGALTWNLGGCALGWLILRKIPPHEAKSDRTISVMCGIQNSFYLPIPLALAILPPEMQAEGMLYLGLAILVTNPMQWTMGTYLMIGRGTVAPTWRETLKFTLNGPTIGVLLGTGLSFVPGLSEGARAGWDAPGALGPVMGSLGVFASWMGPVAMLVLGGMLGATDLTGVIRKRAIFVVTGIKLLLIPAIAFILLQTVFDYYGPLVKFIVMLEAASPPALNIALAAKRFDGDWELCSTTMFPVYATALVTMPLWIAAELAVLGLLG